MPRWYGQGRRSIRLPGYDYASPGYYFVTICIQHRVPLLGEVVDGVMRLNDFGRIVRDGWEWLAGQYDYVKLDEYVVMTDHTHAIIILTNTGRGVSRHAPTAFRKPLGQLIGAFKTVTTKNINQTRQTPGNRVWQRNYYERVIRDEDGLRRIRAYIQNNPHNIR